MAGKIKILSAEELIKRRKVADQELPQRSGGVQKEFAPDGSWLQEKRIEKYYEDRQDLLNEERVEKLGLLARAHWNPANKIVELEKQVKFWQHVGYVEDGKLLLYPEEAVFLMEMGNLEIVYNDVPMSLQQAYSTLLAEEHSEDKYLVYSHLCRMGYLVHRYSHRPDITLYERLIGLTDSTTKKRKNKQNTNKDSKKCKNSEEKNDTDKVIKNSDVQMKDDKVETKEMKCDAILNNDKRTRVNTDYNVPNSTDDVQMDDTPHIDHLIDSNIAKVQKTQISASIDKARSSKDTMRTDPHLFIWDYENIHPFPNIAGKGNCIEITNCSPEFLPPDLEFNTESTILNLEKLTIWPKKLTAKQLQLEERKKSRQARQRDLEASNTVLQFSFPQMAGVVRKSTNCRCWSEYKLEPKKCKKETDLEELKGSPGGPLWKGDVVPLVRPSNARSTASILGRLKVVENIHFSNMNCSVTDAPKISFDVYLPSLQYKKSNPGLPNHRIVVTRVEDPPPDLAILSSLHQTKDGVPLHWAVIDSGDVSFFSFNDVSLGQDIYMG
ncbi:unnamed protein product [Owenia fusiformis]|uniref:Uncharacterized protein n=1 Tax=Owenia fusiformis TaxID=6347 RepID=A0A8J1U9R7_OWEFU|nr:unnamed protein product [Owenia fusiformis]